MNIFDGLQDSVFRVVTNTMGYTVSWQPSTGQVQSAIVLFSDATQTAKILDVPYSPKNCLIEYKRGDLNGLKEAADAGREEIISMNGSDYGVLEVSSKFDGKTMVAHLTLL